MYLIFDSRQMTCSSVRTDFYHLKFNVSRHTHRPTEREGELFPTDVNDNDVYIKYTQFYLSWWSIDI